MTKSQLTVAVMLGLPGLACSALWALGVQTDNQLYGWALIPAAPLGAIGWLGGLGLATYATWQYRQHDHARHETQRSFKALLCGWLILIPFALTLVQYAVLMLHGG